jgi:flagella synthesis protein FlgN
VASPALPAQPIAGILANEFATLRDFVALLKEEQTALVEGKIDALTALTERKSALATRLNDCARRREAALAGLGLVAGRPGMEDWLDAAATDAATRGNWQQLLPLAAEARTLNELNGKLIGTRLQHNQQALAALMGATERAMTYGPDGHTQTKGPGSGRILGSA